MGDETGDRTFDLVGLVHGVVSAGHIQDALRTIAIGTSDFGVWSVYVIMIDDTGTARVAAAYSPIEPAIEPGTTVPISLTPRLEQAALTLMSGRPVIMETASDYGLLGDILRREEGARRIINLPMVANGLIASLSLVCTEQVDLEASDLTHLAQLASGVRDKLGDLLGGLDSD